MDSLSVLWKNRSTKLNFLLLAVAALLDFIPINFAKIKLLLYFSLLIVSGILFLRYWTKYKCEITELLTAKS
jgi:hypothetical protein